jgi:hypothetical protein
MAFCVYCEPARFKQSQVRIGAPNENHRAEVEGDCCGAPPACRIFPLAIGDQPRCRPSCNISGSIRLEESVARKLGMLGL